MAIDPNTKETWAYNAVFAQDYIYDQTPIASAPQHKIYLPRNLISRASIIILFKNLRSTNMINSKRLVQARKWQKLAAMKRRRISFQRSSASKHSSVANKGYFVVYTIDNVRFTVPLEYLSKSVFIVLFRMSEEEFGLPSNGPITLPCDSTFLNYVISLVKRSMLEDLEKALLTSLSTCHFSASSSLGVENRHQQTLIYSY